MTWDGTTRIGAARVTPGSLATASASNSGRATKAETRP